MGLPIQAFDKTKTNYLQKCFYVMNLIKNKDIELWENFQGQYVNTKAEESWELYQILVEEYRKLCAPVKKEKKIKAKKMVKTKAKAKGSKTATKAKPKAKTKNSKTASK